jgi:hypothetical protein
MGFVAQLFESNVHKLPKSVTKAAVLRVLRANKHIAQAVNALAKTTGRQAAILEAIEKNPAFKTAIALELLKHK